MKDLLESRLLVNDDKRDHGKTIKKLLKGAERLECMVAFASASALKALEPQLQRALERGLQARFAVGLDFYQTDPDLLSGLLKLGKKHRVELFLGNSECTFHPKLYAFKHPGRFSVIAGSANFTGGGHWSNYEASILVEDEKGSIFDSVSKHFDALIAEEEVVKATPQRIEEYRREHAIYTAYQKMAKARARKATNAGASRMMTLRDILRTMQEDDSEGGFTNQQAHRKQTLREAGRMLEAWAAGRGLGADFLGRLESLIGQFHSGGLQRGKTIIAEHPREFSAAIVEIVGKRELSPEEAFSVLHGHFLGIRRAGINLLTEILHALDHKRFAVMNQNAVAGMALAGLTDYPAKPSKQSVRAADYARFCEHADGVRRSLGLSDFSELDALFNYAYWGEP
jgi:HKD family nuclease